jgi:hypothetical protein
MNPLQNKWIVGGLCAAAAFSVVYNSVRVPRRDRGYKPPIPRSEHPAVKAAAARFGIGVTPAETVVTNAFPEITREAERDMARLVATRCLTSYTRDPFVAAAPVEDPGLLKERPRVASDVLRLQAIWRQDGGRIAIINGRTTLEGDTVSNYVVVRIESESVIVRSPGLETDEQILLRHPLAPPAAPAVVKTLRESMLNHRLPVSSANPNPAPTSR